MDGSVRLQSPTTIGNTNGLIDTADLLLIEVTLVSPDTPDLVVAEFNRDHTTVGTLAVSIQHPVLVQLFWNNCKVLYQVHPKGAFTR